MAYRFTFCRWRKKLTAWQWLENSENSKEGWLLRCQIPHPGGALAEKACRTWSGFLSWHIWLSWIPGSLETPEPAEVADLLYWRYKPRQCKVVCKSCREEGMAFRMAMKTILPSAFNFIFFGEPSEISISSWHNSQWDLQQFSYRLCWAWQWFCILCCYFAVNMSLSPLLSNCHSPGKIHTHSVCFSISSCKIWSRQILQTVPQDSARRWGNTCKHQAKCVYTAGVKKQ